MARFGRRFEVKNEMRDIKEIHPDDKQQTGGQSTIASQEDIKREANSIGFDDENIGVKDKEELLEEYRTANAQVESELVQYYDEDITQEELKAYLVSKISDIYGEKLAQCNILVDSVIEGFLDINEFNGVECYRQLTQTIEESIMTISKMQGSRDKGKIVEETGAILHRVNGKPIREAETGVILKSVNGRDILSNAIEATERTTRTSTINQEVQNIRSVQKDRTQQQDKTDNGIDR